MVDCSNVTATFDEQHTLKIAVLSKLEDCPRCVWNQPVCPWDYNPTIKKRAKRSSLGADVHIGRNSRGLNYDTKKKQSGTHTPREKKKSSRKNFTYYQEIGEYIKEYREITKPMATDLRNCICHGGYTLRDVEKIYETHSRIKKRDSKRGKAPTAKAENSQSTTVADKVKDEGQDDPSRTNSSQSMAISQTHKGTTSKSGISRGISKQTAGDGIEELVQQHLGRDFFMNHQYLDKKGSSCPVIKIMLPEAHDVRRVSRCGSVSPQKVMTIDYPASVHPLIGNIDISQARNDMKDGSSKRTGRFEAVSPNDVLSSHSPSLLDKSERSRKASTLSAKVRDFRPFSRNGIATRVSNAIKEKQRKRALSDPNVPANNLAKQEIPWKVLRYLGYNPSMRKYLHDIYSPIEHKQSKSPLALSSKRCFNHGNNYDEANVRDNGRIFQKKSQNIGVSHLLAGDNSVRDKTGSNILVTKYLNVCRQERPKIAILPKLDTVVKPKVMKKFIVS